MYALLIARFIVRGTEGYKFSRNDPVDIAVLDFFVVLVLSDVKFSIVEPIESDGVLESPETIKNLNETVVTVHL